MERNSNQNIPKAYLQPIPAFDQKLIYSPFLPLMNLGAKSFSTVYVQYSEQSRVVNIFWLLWLLQPAAWSHSTQNFQD